MTTDPTPRETDHATVSDVVLREHGLAVLGMNHAARATTPGDDRGRELARALDDLGRLVERIDSGTTTIDVSFATRLARARLDVARYVAAPPETEAVVHDPTTEDEDGRCTEYPDLIDRHGARWVWAIGSEYRARHVLGGWKCRDGAYIRRVFGPVTEVPATAPTPEGEAGSEVDWRARYSELIGKVDEWVAERCGDAAREDLIADLGVDGWLRVGWPPPVPAGPQAEGAGETAHDCSPAVAAELLRLARSYEKSRRDGNELVLPSTGLRRRAAELTSGAADEAASKGGSS